MANRARTSATPRVHIRAHERLSRLCAEIQKGRYPTKADLARVIGCDPRTIQRNLQALVKHYKAPLAFDRQENGFYFTERAWRLPPFAITQGELINFFAAERLLRRMGTATAEVQLARDAVHALAARLPSEVVVDLTALEQAISFAPEPVLDARPDDLRKLTAAALKRQTLHLNYYSQHRDAYTERDVDVLLVHNHLGEWYAVGHDHLSGEIRDFHVGRILNLTQTRRTYTPPADWNPDAYLRRGFGMFRGGQEVTIVIEFDAYQARYAKERTFHPTQKTKSLPGGGLRLSFVTTEAALEQVARWVMQYGEHALAVQPAKLRELLRERLTRAAALYLETASAQPTESHKLNPKE